MKKISQIQEDLKTQKVTEIQRLDEANKYIEFSKAYYKKHGVSGPFDPKVKGDKKFMADLGKAWADHKAKTEKPEKKDKTEKK